MALAALAGCGRASAPATERGCGFIDEIDSARLSPTTEVFDSVPKTADAIVREVMPDAARRSAATPRAAKGEADLTVVVMPGFMPEPKTLEFQASRRGGAWTASVVISERPRDDKTPGRTTRREATLSLADGAHIDAALADGCLWRTPHLIDNAVPLKGGRTETSFDAPSGVYAFRTERGVWNGVQISHGVGPPAVIARVLMNALAKGTGPLTEGTAERVTGPNGR